VTRNDIPRRTILVTATLASVLLAPAAPAITLGGGGDPVPVDLSKTFDVAADPATAAKTFIVARGQPKNVTRLGIASFCVGVVVGRSAQGSSSGASALFSSKVVAGLPGGVPVAGLLAAADAAYDRFEADLKAAGIEVVPYEELAAKPSFQKFASKLATEPVQVQEDEEYAKNKSGMKQVVVFSPKKRPFLKDCRNLAPGTIGTMVRLGFEQDLRGTALASVNLTIDFATAVAPGGLFGGSKVDLQYGQYLSPGISNASLAVWNGGAPGTLWLKQAIVPAQNPFKEGGKGEVKRETKIDNEYDPFSSYTRSTTQSTTVDADQELWSRNVDAHAKALMAMFAAALQAGK
jgi:hypothetical protein